MKFTKEQIRNARYEFLSREDNQKFKDYWFRINKHYNHNLITEKEAYFMIVKYAMENHNEYAFEIATNAPDFQEFDL